MLLLDGQNMLTRESAHDELARVLSFPDYYGRNLDALWDCVSTMQAEVTLVNASAMRDALGDYADALISTLDDASMENPTFSFICSE